MGQMIETAGVAPHTTHKIVVVAAFEDALEQLERVVGRGQHRRRVTASTERFARVLDGAARATRRCGGAGVRGAVSLFSYKKHLHFYER